MIYALGSVLQHKQESKLVLLLKSFNELDKKYMVRRYVCGKLEDRECFFDEDVIKRYFQLYPFKYKIGDIFVQPGNKKKHRYEIMHLSPFGYYESLLTIDDAMQQHVLLDDPYIKTFNLQLTYSIPIPDPNACKCEVVDVGFQISKMVCKHCNKEHE